MGRGSVVVLGILLTWSHVACKKPTEAAPAPDGSAVAPTAAPTAPPAPKAAAQPDAPDVVAKRYLELGAGGDLTKIKDLVDPACASTKVGDVDAVKMMGARMTLTDVETKVDGAPTDRAKVKYTVKGSVDAKEAHTETDIFGKKATVKVGSLSMKGVTQSGSLDLVKLDGRWVVGCGK